MYTSVTRTTRHGGRNTCTLADAMSIAELMFAARELARDISADAACTAVLEELQRRTPAGSFDAFVAEIYA